MLTIAPFKALATSSSSGHSGFLFFSLFPPGETPVSGLATDTCFRQLRIGSESSLPRRRRNGYRTEKFSRGGRGQFWAEVLLVTFSAGEPGGAVSSKPEEELRERKKMFARGYIIISARALLFSRALLLLPRG